MVILRVLCLKLSRGWNLFAALIMNADCCGPRNFIHLIILGSLGDLGCRTRLYPENIECAYSFSWAYIHYTKYQTKAKFDLLTIKSSMLFQHPPLNHYHWSRSSTDSPFHMLYPYFWPTKSLAIY